MRFHERKMTKIAASPPPRTRHRFTSRSNAALEIAHKVSATIGVEFFQTIAKHLTKLLAADCVLLGEFPGSRMEMVRTLGAYMDGHAVSFQFALPGSASAAIVLGKPYHCCSAAQTRFPSDHLISRVGAQAVLGLPLLDAGGHAIGLIMALFRRAVADLGAAREMLLFFSERAAAELNRKRQEDELRESEQRYRAFVAKNRDAMWRIEFEKPVDTAAGIAEQMDAFYRYGYIAECNDAMARAMGLERAEQAIGFRLEDVAPRSEASNREAMLLAIQQGYEFTTLETTRRTASGLRHLLRSQWGIVEGGKLERIWGTTRDITDLKLSEQALDASERRMSDLLQTMKLVVLIEDAGGAVTYANRYFRRLTGWRQGDIKGRTWIDLMVPGEERDRLRELFARANAAPETPIHFEGTLIGPDAQAWQFEWDRTSLRDRNGRVAAWANIGRDATERKALETHLRQAQKLAIVGKLAAGLAHDFNNLLTVVLGYSSRLLEDPEHLDPSSYTALDEIRKAAEHGAEITHRLLAVGRRQILRPRAISLDSLLEDSRHMLQTLIGHDIRLKMKLDASGGPVRIDPHSFHQVLLNLAVNARDAMPSGGTLTIATSAATVSEPESQPVSPGEYVLVKVSDTGTGMSEEVRNHLFEPFFTTKPMGKASGLGLSMVYGIIQQSGGRIFVDSAPEKGSTFRIYLPRIDAEIPQEEPIELRVPGHGTETILLVEDREEIRTITARTLRDLGYAVLEAEGASTALAFVRDGGRPIDLLLTDVAMPGMNGFELADLIHCHRTGMKTLFVSGYLDPDSVTRKPPAPAYAYLQKPYTPKALAASVRELLDRAA
jgi:PAS domain S-box-containing protein